MRILIFEEEGKEKEEEEEEEELADWQTFLSANWQTGRLADFSYGNTKLQIGRLADWQTFPTEPPNYKLSP